MCREITALLHLCYTFVTLFITSLLRILWHFVRFFIFWHFVRIPAFAVELEFLLQTHPICMTSEYLDSCHVDLNPEAHFRLLLSCSESPDMFMYQV